MFLCLYGYKHYLRWRYMKRLKKKRSVKKCKRSSLFYRPDPLLLLSFRNVLAERFFLVLILSISIAFFYWYFWFSYLNNSALVFNKQAIFYSFYVRFSSFYMLTSSCTFCLFSATKHLVSGSFKSNSCHFFLQFFPFLDLFTDFQDSF